MLKAYILITCETGSECSIIANLNSIYSVNAVGIFGPYDGVAQIKTDTDKQIQEIVSKIRRLKKIRGTLTLITQEGKDLFGEKFTEMEKETIQKFMSSAFVIIHTKSTEQGNIMRKLAEIPSVIEAEMVIGSYQLICKVVAPTYNDISDIITKKIRSLENIESTLTLNIIEKIIS